MDRRSPSKVNKKNMQNKRRRKKVILFLGTSVRSVSEVSVKFFKWSLYDLKVPSGCCLDTQPAT